MVVWKVVDTAEATFEVDDYVAYVRVQSESALRNAATSYPYDSHDEPDVISLRGSTAVVAEHLKQEMQQRLQKAGVEVVETRISHLAYAPEIAAAMLQRQQAGAIIAARTRIVEGAVGMVEMALEARISHLAYAPEIAAAMLQRQQAGAIIAARERIVQGAVGMVEMALGMLSTKDIVHLDEERKAAMVSNLLVVLCGERGAQPVLNTGTIHQ